MNMPHCVCRYYDCLNCLKAKRDEALTCRLVGACGVWGFLLKIGKLFVGFSAADTIAQSGVPGSVVPVVVMHRAERRDMMFFPNYSASWAPDEIMS